MHFANEKISKEYASYHAYHMVSEELQRISLSIITFDLGFITVFDEAGPVLWPAL